MAKTEKRPTVTVSPARETPRLESEVSIGQRARKVQVARARSQLESALKSAVRPLTESEIAEELRAFDREFLSLSDLWYGENAKASEPKSGEVMPIFDEKLDIGDHSFVSKGLRGFLTPTIGASTGRGLLGSYRRQLSGALREKGYLEDSIDRKLSEYFKKRIAASLGNTSDETKKQFIKGLASQLGVHVQFESASSQRIKLIPSPSNAPETWTGFDNPRQENPAQFIRRVYKKFMGRGLTTANIKTLDELLYDAFFYWKKKSEKPPAGFYLPTKEEWYDRLAGDPELLNQLEPSDQAKVHRAIAQRDTRRAKKASPR